MRLSTHPYIEAGLTALFRVCSGGRKIKVSGTGFDLVQRAVMRVLPSTDEFNLQSSNDEVSIILTSRNNNLRNNNKKLFCHFSRDTVIYVGK